MRLAWMAVALAGGVLATACDRPDEAAETPRAAMTAKPAAAASKPPPLAAPAEPRLAGFSHAPGRDVFGYYMTDGVQAGSLRLTHLHMGGEEEFRAWEGGERTATYAPVMLVFEDVSSPEVETELGPVRSVGLRVLPYAYAVEPGRVRFAGRDATLGEITFDGRLDAKALAAARDQVEGADPTVLRGTLKIGQRSFPGVAFSWFGGD